MLKPCLRLDLSSRRSLPKEDLLRFVKIDGKLIFDKESKLPGRGYYLSKDPSCIEKARQKHLLEKKAGVPIQDSLYEEILNEK